MALTREQIRSLRAGDKLVIVEDPGEGFNGHQMVNKVITVADVGATPNGGIYCKEFRGGWGTIDARHVNLVEEEKMFTKNDLKSWMRVKTRNGKMYIVVAERGILVRDGHNHLELKYSEDNLLRSGEGNSNYDIVAVYFPPTTHHNYLDPSEHGGILWECGEETGAQKQYEALQKKMKELQEEMDKLQPLV